MLTTEKINQYFNEIMTAYVKANTNAEWLIANHPEYKSRIAGSIRQGEELDAAIRTLCVVTTTDLDTAALAAYDKYRKSKEFADFKTNIVKTNPNPVEEFKSFFK